MVVGALAGLQPEPAEKQAHCSQARQVSGIVLEEVHHMNPQLVVLVGILMVSTRACRRALTTNARRTATGMNTPRRQWIRSSGPTFVFILYLGSSFCTLLCSIMGAL